MRPGGLEPPTCGLGNRCSILLSYERGKSAPQATPELTPSISLDPHRPRMAHALTEVIHASGGATVTARLPSNKRLIREFRPSWSMSETQPPIRKPRRRWRRRLAVTLLLLPVFMVGGLWMSQRWWLPMVVRPGVERLTGMQFDAATMRIGPDGRIRINRPSLRDHDHDATVTATALDARINWRSAWGGRIDIHDVVVHDPVLTMDIAFTSALWDRLSPATEPHEQEWLTSLPEISLVGAVLELTETTPQGRIDRFDARRWFACPAHRRSRRV